MPCTATSTVIAMNQPTAMGTNMTDMALARVAIELLDLKGEVQLRAKEDGTIEVITRTEAQERKRQIVRKYSEMKVEREARRRGYVVTKSSGTNNQTKLHVVVKGR